jgi:hypothetical protein
MAIATASSLLEPCQSNQSLAPSSTASRWIGRDWKLIFIHRAQTTQFVHPFFLAPILITSLVATTGRQAALPRVENPHNPAVVSEKI